jgi:succinoglycan biosynthesis transport protein ExoP
MMSPASIDDRTLPPLFDIAALWAILWGRRLMIFVITGAVLLLTVLYLLVTSPSYTATASILIDPRDSRSTNFNNVLPGIGSDSAAIASQVFVIESQDLLGDVFDGQKVENDPEFSGRGLVSRLFSIFGSDKKATRDATFKRFQKAVSVEREGLTYVINVSFTSKSPETAARIANAIVERYRTGLAGEREGANSDVNSLLNDRIKGLQKDVSDAERAVEDFKTTHRIVDPTDGGTLQFQLDQLTTQLITAQGDADQARDRYNQALAVGSSPAGLARLAEILSSNSAIKLRDDYNQRAAELANLETMYGPRHPAIARLRSELERMNRLMGAEADRIRQQLKASYDLAAQNVGKLQAKLEALRQQSSDSSLAQVQLRQLDSKAQAARGVLDEYLKRAKETSQMEGVQTSEARTIAKASPPLQPTWPKPALLLPVSAVLGLLAGCGLALAFGPVRRPEDEPQAPKEEVVPAVQPRQDAPRAAAQPAPQPLPASLGEYRVPASGTALSGIKAIRASLFQDGDEALSRDVLKLMRQIILRLHDHPKPFVLAVSSTRGSLEARLAGALIGISLQRVEQNVLVVEIEGQPSASADHGPGIFVDSASGLRTAICSPQGQKGGRTLGDVLTEAGNAFDFILVSAPAFSEKAWSPEFFTRADLTLLALTPSEQAADAASLLAQRLGVAQIGRSATLVIAPQTAQPAARTPVPPSGADWRRSSAARS